MARATGSGWRSSCARCRGWGSCPMTSPGAGGRGEQGVQLGIPIADLAGYGARAQTRTKHLRVVADRLGWRTAGRAEWKELEEFLLVRAIEHDAPSVLFRLGCEYLHSAKVVRRVWSR